MLKSLSQLEKPMSMIVREPNTHMHVPCMPKTYKEIIHAIQYLQSNPVVAT